MRSVGVVATALSHRVSSDQNGEGGAEVVREKDSATEDGERIRVWSPPPGFGRVVFDGAWLGTLAGGVVGLLPSLAGAFFLIPVGAAVGLAHGLFFALGGWGGGWIAVRLGIAKRKVLALFIGVVLTGLIYPFVVTAFIDDVDPILAWGVSFLAVVMGAFRGRDYGRLIETTISDVTD